VEEKWLLDKEKMQLMSSEMIKSEESRAQQNDYILKLRGNIRVFARVKPVPDNPSRYSTLTRREEDTILEVPKQILQKEALRKLSLKDKTKRE
jgi:hypothetical protein